MFEVKKFESEVSKLGFLVEEKKSEIICGFLLAAIAAVIMFAPDHSAAASLEQQLDGLHAVTVGKFKKVAIGGGTIFGVAVALFQGSLRMCVMIVAIGILFAYYLNWIEGGMTF